MKQNNNPYKLITLIIIESFLVLLLLSAFPTEVFAGVGEDNTTSITILGVGNSFPEVQNTSIENNDSAVALTPNSTKTIQCVSIIVDYNGDSDINSTWATFYDTASSSHGAPDDNNDHYTNTSCSLNTSYGDMYSALSNCTFEVEYYANPQTWRCNVTANDSSSAEATGYDEIDISQLLALGLPDVINYSTVNATSVSNEVAANVTNVGNVQVNLSLEGYARTQGDGYAMNCTYGSLQNISIDYEKYNLTNSTQGSLSLTEFEANYTNLTSTASIKTFELNYRQNDTVNKAIDTTYWRIYIPKGVAGTCTGNIVFGATTAAGS